MVLCASPPGLKETFRCQHRDLILTRSAYDHKRMRPLKPMVGVVKSLGYYRRGPVALIRTQKFQVFSKQKTHFALSFSACDRCCRKSLFWLTNEIFQPHWWVPLRGNVRDHIESQ